MSEKFQTESQGSTFYIPPPPYPTSLTYTYLKLPSTSIFIYIQTYLIAADQKHSAPASAKKARITGYGKARNFHTMDCSNVELNTVVDKVG